MNLNDMNTQYTSYSGNGDKKKMMHIYLWLFSLCISVWNQSSHKRLDMAGSSLSLSEARLWSDARIQQQSAQRQQAGLPCPERSCSHEGWARFITGERGSRRNFFSSTSVWLRVCSGWWIALFPRVQTLALDFTHSSLEKSNRKNVLGGIFWP